MQVWHWDGFFDYLFNTWLLGGALVTIGLTVSALCFGLVLGLVLAVARRSALPPVAWLAAAYQWLFRGTPLLVQLLMIYTALPLVGVSFSVTTAGVLGLSLNEAAYLSEIVRAGLLAVPPGQRDAAAALGLSRLAVFRRVVWPQALRVMIPPLGNSVNGLLKTTSLVSVISMEELLRRTQLLVQERFMVLELFTVAALYYLAMTSAWGLVQAKLERRFGRPFISVRDQDGA